MSQDRNDSSRKPRQKFSEGNAREFGCPCGKSYLSYPALYTHVRTKHDGKPPGEIVKPKNEKTRGRPRTIIVETPIDDSQCPFNASEEISKLLEDVDVHYEDDFDKSEGKSSCQDMASKFLQEVDSLDQTRVNTVKFYLNQLHRFVNKKLGMNYWTEHSPEDLIDIANEFEQHHANHLQEFPIPNQVFIQLTYIFFKWMYRNKWISHKLVRRKSAPAHA